MRFASCRRKALMMLCIVLCLMVCHAVAEEPSFPFYRFDLDSPDAWREPLANVRFLTQRE